MSLHSIHWRPGPLSNSKPVTIYLSQALGESESGAACESCETLMRAFVWLVESRLTGPDDEDGEVVVLLRFSHGGDQSRVKWAG